MTGAPVRPPQAAPGNRRILVSLVMIVVGMGCLAYASVPLYRVFCQVTGFGGTTQRATAAPAHAAARMMTVRFDANVADVPWEFEPDQRAVAVHVGENTLATFHAHNAGQVPITGTATFNVTPTKVGRYFDKIQCFCFTEQTLKPGETAELPVSFFVDPAILQDRNLDDVDTITLSYTFFRAKNQAADRVAAGPAAPAAVKR